MTLGFGQCLLLLFLGLLLFGNLPGLLRDLRSGVRQLRQSLSEDQENTKDSPGKT